MGLQDRDYMKRRTDDEAERSSSLESRAEAIAERILAKAGKAIPIACITLAILAVIIWAVSRYSGPGH